MLGKPVREATYRLLSSESLSLEPLCSCLTTDASICSKGLALLGNMCGDAQLRQCISYNNHVMTAVIHKALPAAANAVQAEVAAAAMSCLYNFSIEPSAQQVVCSSSGYVEALLQLVCDLSKVSAVAASSCNTSTMQRAPQHSSSKPVKGLPGSGLAAKNKTSAVNSTTVDKGSEQHADASPLSYGAAAAGVLARVGKQAAGAAVLRASNGLQQLVKALAAYQKNCCAAAPAANSPQMKWLSGVVQTVAVLTADAAHMSCSLQDATLAIHSLVAAIKGADVPETLLGNAALCLGHYANCEQWHQVFREAGSVAALVKVAYDGEGNSASRNAAIALARLAKDAGMLDGLRELHGIEIIYKYGSGQKA